MTTKNADQYLKIHPWKITEEGFHPDHSEISESLFSLANEYQGVRGFFDEGYTGTSLVGVYLNGIYEERFTEGTAYKGISNRLAFMVNTVNWLATRISLEGETLDLAVSRFHGFQRELDFRTGELSREFIWETQSGKHLKLTFSRLLSMDTPELACQKIEMIALDFDGRVTLTSGLDFAVPHRSFGHNFWECPRCENGAILGVTESIHHRLFAGMKISTPGESREIRDEKYVGFRVEIPLHSGQPQTFEKRVILYSARDPEQPLAEAWERGLTLLNESTQTYAEVFQENTHYWQEFWAKSDIHIDGDAETQQGIRFCIFQMQQTYRGVVPGANIGAKGLTGEAYNGNAFWDTETYCLPFYLFSNPRAAKALIDFRYKTLPQAKARAHDLDCAGACFPIATSDGTESCTLWQHASLQLQPTTAVAYAIWHYVKITGDSAFLQGEGGELLVEICRFLATRGQWSPQGKFGYYAVMGPDEFQMMVNNNAYTNYMARRTFEYTLSVLRAGEAGQFGVNAEEMADWERMAQAMILPYDPQTGLYEQHEGFFRLPHIDVDAIPVTDFPLYYHWAYDRIYRNDMIKQPDVLMFLFLYNQSFSREEKRANYEYYEPRCIHESSLSPSVHSILAQELGKTSEAFDFFRFAARIDLDNYNRNSGEGIHTTSIAAAWMNIVYGFGGMRSDGDVLSFQPTIPAHWSGYGFQIAYRGSRIQIEVKQKEASLRVSEGQPVTVKVAGNLVQLDQKGISIELA
jgi:maltose phosphorylase